MNGVSEVIGIRLQLDTISAIC